MTSQKKSHSSPRVQSKPVIELKGVWKTYRMGSTTVEALKEVDMTIRSGEFVAITGSSGSGKSTLMSLVGALDVPTKGTILLDGHNISRLAESDLASIRGRKIGFVFQQFHLLGTLTALENVMLPMEFQEQSHAKEAAIKALEVVGLKPRMHHTPKQLSGGQQQRVAIARAIAHNPELILADEPTGNLDSKTGKEIMDLFLSLNEQGKTIVLVTHDTNLVKYSERVIKLADGKVVSEGAL